MSTTETVRAWSTTAASNNTADTAITSSDSQSPDTLDNNVRSIMAAVKKQMNDIGGALTAGGTANALTVTTGQVLETGQLVAGLRILVRATADNTTAGVTFAPDGLTAASIKRADGTALSIGAIQEGMYLDLAYNTGSSEWRAMNIVPSAVFAAVAKTWAMFDPTGGLGGHWNVTSITDNGVGSWTVNVGTDFSSNQWAGLATAGSASGNYTAACCIAQAAGTYNIGVSQTTNGIAVDPTTPQLIFFVGFGTQ